MSLTPLHPPGSRRTGASRLSIGEGTLDGSDFTPTWFHSDRIIAVSGQINNKVRPMCSSNTFPTSGVTIDSGANDEIFSYHSGGANCLFGDGSVRFLKDSINLVVLRSIVTIAGGEVISSDQY